MATMPQGKIETTVEMTSELPESLKAELRKKRRKLKEKKLKISSEEKSFDLEEIQPEPEEETYPENSSPGNLPKHLPQIPKRRLPVPPERFSNGNQQLDDTLHQQSTVLQPLRPLPPPRKSKKVYELQELVSHTSKAEKLSSNGNVAEHTLSEMSNGVLDSEENYHESKHEKLKQKQKENSAKKKFPNDRGINALHHEEGEISDYDFFTRVWDQDPELESTPCETSETADEIFEEDTDSVRLIQKELQKTGIEIVKLEPASYVPFQIKIEKERNSFFHPSYKPVPMKLKLPEGKEPKSSTEEDTVVGKTPNISNRNMNKLENRLLNQKEFQWFGEDGLVKMLPDPVCESPIRQVPEDPTDNFPIVEYVKASLNSEHYKLKPDSGKGYQLELDISSISFLHHPLFSTEHVIESRLLQMCDKHSSNVKEDLVNVSKLKLKELRSAVSNLKQSMQKGMQETSINYERQLRLKQHQKDIRQTKKLRDFKESEQKSLWASILGTWEELKLCRQNQLFTSTSLNLNIQEERPDRATEKEEWERELMEELEEEMEDYEACSEKLFEEYESALHLWKQWNKDRKMALKRHKLRQKQKEDSQVEDESESGEDLLVTKLQDEKILSEPEMPKPKPVPKFNSATTLEKLKSNAIKMRKSPGEPLLHITIDHDTPITPLSECPRDEMQRRNAVIRKKLYFKIMFNDKKVSETCERNIGQDFKAVWGQIFKLQILHAPHSLRIEILEGGFINGTLLAELFIPIPAASQTSLYDKPVDHQFCSDKSSPPKNTAVGSGVLHKFKDGNETFLLTNGVLKCSLTWGVDEDGNVLVPSSVQEHRNETENPNPISHLVNSRFFNVDKLRQWIKKSNLDPHNTENAAIFQFFQDLGLEEDNGAEEGSDCYRLEPLRDELEFCSAEEIESNKRFQLLHLRDQQVAEFQNLRMIPADEKDVKEDMIESLKRRASDIQKKENEGEEQREQAKILMQKVREEVAKRFYVSQHQRLLEDVVTEEKVPSIGTIGFSILKVFQTKRPLYPERKDRKKVVCSNVNLDVKIIVRILHASNVPVRKDSSSMKEPKEKSGDSTVFFESQVQPFVEVMFQRTAIKTGIAEGPHPTWNQELELPFRAPNGNYSPSNLEGVKDAVYINLFDEVTVDLLEGGREGVVHERLERRWLGNLKVPFTTLYLNSKIEGTFRINIPPVLLSYENEPRPWLSGLSDAASSHTYLSFFMTIEPCLQLPDVFRDQFDSTEPEKVLCEVEKWRQSVIPRYPDRMIKLMAVDLSGKWIFVTRFLRPLAPPEELTNGNQASLEVMELLARFVSLIPTVADSVTFPGLCDIWSTSDQFLQMLTGDEEEHAILLCSFFLHLGKRSTLLLGSGIPEGPTAYVATWETSPADVFVWNASTGDHFSVSNNHCPLQNVGCLISPDNVWANIQKSNHPSRISFDLSKASDWKPFFSRSFPNPGLRSIQPSSLTYNTTDPDYVEKLQKNIEKCLKESIEKWRQNISTVWNKKCNKILYKVLTKLERNVGRTASDDSLQELEHTLSKFKVDGFPLTMPYTDVDAVIETVFATGIHLTEDGMAEFSVAVYVHPYPCCVMAVWVYVAVLIPRKCQDTAEDLQEISDQNELE